MQALLKTKAASRYLDIPEPTLAHMRSHREGPPFVRIGRSIMYRLSDLEAYVAGLEPVKNEKEDN